MSHVGTASINLQSALSGGSLRKPLFTTSRFALQRNIKSGRISRGARVNFAEKLTMFTPPPTPPTSALSVTLPVGASPAVDVTQVLSKTVSPVKTFVTGTEFSPTGPLLADSAPTPYRPRANTANNARAPVKGTKNKSLSNFSELLLMFMAIIFGVCVIYIISRIIKITRNVRCIEHSMKAAGHHNSARTLHGVTVSDDRALQHANGVATHADVDELGDIPSMLMLTTPHSFSKMAQPQSKEGEPTTQSVSTLPDAEVKDDQSVEVGGDEFTSAESNDSVTAVLNQAPGRQAELESVEIETIETPGTTENEVNAHAHAHAGAEAEAEALGPEQEIKMGVDTQPFVVVDGGAHVDGVIDITNVDLNSDAGTNNDSRENGADHLLNNWRCELAEHNPFVLEVITRYPENVVVLGDVPTPRLCEQVGDKITSPLNSVHADADADADTGTDTVVPPAENTHDYSADSKPAYEQILPVSCSFHLLTNEGVENAQQPLVDFFERIGDEMFEFDKLEMHAELMDLDEGLGDMKDCIEVESVCNSPVNNTTAELCTKSETPLVHDSVLASSGIFTHARAVSSYESEGSDSAVDDEPSSKQRGENSVSVARIVTQGIEPLKLILESMQKEMLIDERKHDTDKRGEGVDSTQTSDTSSDSDSKASREVTKRKTRASTRPVSKANLVPLLSASTDNVKQKSRGRSTRSKTIGQAADTVKPKIVRVKKTASNQKSTTEAVFI